MKTTLFSLLIVICGMAVFPHTSVAQDTRPIVRLIYFLPKDREPQPDINARMDKLIKDVQLFYAEHMENHGFGRKTFEIEADAQGNVVVHHIKGKFNDAYYHNPSWAVWDEIEEHFDWSKNIYLTALDISTGSIDNIWCGRGGPHGVRGGAALISAFGGCFSISTAAHELGHAFGLNHDNRGQGTWISSSGIADRMVTSFCAAEWLDVHRCFNVSQAPSEGSPPIIKMLSSSLAFPPNAIRLRFKVTNRNRLHQAQLHTPELEPYVVGGFIGCKALNGSTNTIVEFVTTELRLKSTEVSLNIIDVDGNFSYSASFPIDVGVLLPPSKVVSIPDANLAAAVRESLDLTPRDVLTTQAMLNLTHLEARNRGITDLTGLEHALYLVTLNLGAEDISWEAVNSNAVSDVSPLFGLTQLKSLDLSLNPLSDVSFFFTELTNLSFLKLDNNNIDDITPLANLTQLAGLVFSNNGIDDITPLANLTQLITLDLSNNSISDITPLTNLTQLEELWLDNNNIDDITPLTNLTQLAGLVLSNNNIDDITPLTNVTQLAFLWLQGNRIDDVSTLAGFIRLRDLDLGENNIDDITPLANLTQLTGLLLYNNSISNVSALKKLTQLTHLDLWGNNISDVSALKKLTQLTHLDLGNNPLSQASINKHIPAMQAKGIKVDFDNTTTYIGENTTIIEKITGPWLWMIAPTQKWQGGATSTDIDSLALASDGAITESDVATHGAKVGDTIGKYSWMLGTISATGSNNINELINRIGLSANRYIDDHSSYALISLESATVQSGVTMRAGSDDSIKIWLNGEVVHNKPVDRGAYDFLDTFKVDLKKGDNLLLVKVSERGGDWSMFVGIEADANAIYKSPQDPGPRVDVNGDGVVNIQDLVLVSSRFGQTGQNSADVNGDGVVNISDLVLVAGAFGGGPAAAPLLYPSALESFTAAEMQRYLMQARQMGFTDSDALRGIAVLEQLLALLLPKETSLLTNYPNPFNPETWIPYQLAKSTEVTLHIYSVNGTLIRTLALGHQAAGMYHSKSRAAYWDGRNSLGETVASGIYFYTLTAGDFTATRKLMIRK